MKPKSRNLFMNLLTRDRVVPIISASISWLNLPTIGSGLPSLPKFARRRRSRARRFSLELNNWSIKSSSIRLFRVNRYDMNNSENPGSLWIAAIIVFLSRRVITHASTARAVAMRSGWPFRHPSPKKWPGPRIATTASLPCLETTTSLTLPCWM